MSFQTERIALIVDLVFGVCVWNGRQWFPLSQCDSGERKIVQDALDWAPGCPQKILDAVYEVAS